MVGHEAVGMDGVTEFLPVAAQSFNIRLVVAVIEKSLLPLIAADDDVVEQTGGKKSGAACHDWGL